MSKEVEFNIRFVADKPDTREKGLMFAEPLEEMEVVLFVFPKVDEYAFWNKNVSFPLSLAFIDEYGQIVDFADMGKNSTQRAAPNSSNIKYVIEARKGIFNKLHIQKGDLVRYNNNLLQIKLLH